MNKSFIFFRVLFDALIILIIILFCAVFNNYVSAQQYQQVDEEAEMSDNPKKSLRKPPRLQSTKDNALRDSQNSSSSFISQDEQQLKQQALPNPTVQVQNDSVIEPEASRSDQQNNDNNTTTISSSSQVNSESDKATSSSSNKRPSSANQKSSGVTINVQKIEEGKVGSDYIPEGQELVNIDFPEPTELQDIIRAVALWTGKNVILGPDVRGKVQMISPKKVTKAEAYQAFLSALNMLGYTTVETGRVIKVIRVTDAVRSNLKTYLGSSWTPLTDELITQIVPLKYISAREIQTTLSRIVSTNSIIAYEPTNTLIISDSGFKVRRVLDIIELLDVQTQQPQILVVPIRYGDAKQIASLVNEILSGPSNIKSRKNMKYKLLTDERTNSVVIFGPPRTISDVRELVKRFDTPVEDSSYQAMIYVRPLDYADAKKLAATLSSLATGTSRVSNRRPLGGSSSSSASNSLVANFNNDVKITADEESNSLLISGSRLSYEAINNLIKKLDIRRSQVFVESEILDITAEGGFKFGTSLLTGASSKNNTNMAYTWEAKKLAPLIEAQVSSSSTSKIKAAGVFGDDLSIGILGGTNVNVPGLGEISPGALIRLIKTDAATQVLSSPKILTSNNEEAEIIVGDKLFFKNTDINPATGVVATKIEREDVDLSLKIKPNISNSNYVTLKIDLQANTPRIDSESRLPTVNKRKSSQLVTVKNGQTVVISGLTKVEEQEVYKKIPLLGDIPIIGWLFRNTDMLKKRVTLLIFLTPHIIHGANDLAAIYESKLKERDEFLEKIFGSNFKKSFFYSKLPKKEDGEFKQDQFDIIEDKNREKRRQELMLDMGYSESQMQGLQSNSVEEGDTKSKDITPREDITIPMPSVGNDSKSDSPLDMNDYKLSPDTLPESSSKLEDFPNPVEKDSFMHSPAPDSHDMYSPVEPKD